MNGKKLVLLAVIAAFVLNAFSAGPAFAQKKEEAKPQEKEKVYIPKDIKAIFEQGLAARQGQTGIPLTITQHLFFPYYRAQDIVHNVFQLKIKNSDLGFAPAQAPGAPAAKPEETKAGEKKETTSAFEEVPSTDMEARFDLFLQFRETADNVPGKVVKEVYVPTEIIIPAADYKPEEESFYYVGYDLAPGSYLLVAGVQRFVPSPDQKKLQSILGSTYFDFSAPDPTKLEGKLETSPLLITKSVEQLQGQETRTLLHRGYFTYLVLKITPNVAKAIPSKSPLDILYFVMGAKANDQGKFALETGMKVMQADKPAIEYASTVYEAPYVSLPLPMQQTMKTTTGTSAKTETKDLGPGKYTLVVTITDKNGGGTVTESLDFEII